MFLWVGKCVHFCRDCPTIDRQRYGAPPNPDAEWLESVRHRWKAFVTDVKNELDPIVGELAISTALMQRQSGGAQNTW